MTIKQRFPIGTQFALKHANRTDDCEIVDVMRTFDRNGECERLEYVVAYRFCGQEITARVVDTTIARALPADVLAQYVDADFTATEFSVPGGAATGARGMTFDEWLADNPKPLNMDLRTWSARVWKSARAVFAQAAPSASAQQAEPVVLYGGGLTPVSFEGNEELDDDDEEREGPATTVRWDLFPAWLIDHHEGETITEEGLQHALAAMLKAQPASHAPAQGMECAVRAISQLRDEIKQALDIIDKRHGACGATEAIHDKADAIVSILRAAMSREQSQGGE